VCSSHHLACLFFAFIHSIAALVASHEKAFGDIKTYYNEITHSNLDLIKTLKDEVCCNLGGSAESYAPLHVWKITERAAPGCDNVFC